MESNTLLKQENLLKLKNEKIFNQLIILENIQNAILNKSRIIEQINLNIQEQDLNIKVLLFGILLAIILFIAVLFYGYKKIKIDVLFFIFIILLLCFFIIYIYSYNIFYFYDVISSLFGHNLQRLEYNIIKNSENIDKNLRTNLYGDESTWMNNNCDCPDIVQEEILYANDGNIIESDDSNDDANNIYYYDRSAPQQLIMPLPPSIYNEKSSNYDKIDWVDFSYNGNKYYNKSNLNNNIKHDNQLVNYETNTNSL